MCVAREATGQFVKPLRMVTELHRVNTWDLSVSPFSCNAHYTTGLTKSRCEKVQLLKFYEIRVRIFVTEFLIQKQS